LDFGQDLSSRSMKDLPRGDNDRGSDPKVVERLNALPVVRYSHV